MAVRASIATGNFLTAGTWGLIDGTSYNNSETTTTALTTSYQASAGTTTGVETLDGVYLKLAVRTGTTGTMSVHLAIAGVEVTGTLVTINTADLPTTVNAGDSAWVFFKFSAPVTLVGATSYTVEAKTSSASQVSLFSLSGTDWSRAFRTTTTGAPAAGDDLIVAGEYTGAGTSNTITVTMNETATTDYGAAATSLVTPSLAICTKGVLTFGTTASTNYYLKQSGNVIVYSNGILNIGTSGTPMPSTSSAILEFDSASNVDFGLIIRPLGTFNAYGNAITNVSALLAADASAAATSLTTNISTGWLNGDEIAIASTTRTASECEKKTLGANASGTSLPTIAAITNAHSGTSPTQAELINLTRNVKIRGVSTSLQGYCVFQTTSTVTCQYVEFYQLGSATSSKRGIDCSINTGSCSITFCSLHDFAVASSIGFNITQTNANNITFSNNVTFGVANSHFSIVATSGTSWTVDSNIFIRSTDAGSSLISLADFGGTFTNNTMIGGATGLSMTDNAAFGTFSNLTVHSCSSQGFALNTAGVSGPLGGSLTNLTSWRNNGAGFNLNVNTSGVTFDTATFFGNSSNNLQIGSSNICVCDCTFISWTLNGDTTFSTTNGFNLSGINSGLFRCKIISCDFSTVSGIKTAHTTDINMGGPPSNMDLVLRNTKLGAATEIGNQSNMGIFSIVGSEKHDQTAGLHKSWKKYGTITIEGTTVHSGANSFKMTPNNASNKLMSGSFFVAVANGASLTPSVYVYEDASYNGARSRLILKRNDAIGITSDTVIKTATAASDAAWEQLSTATAAATDDGVMEFVIDCDGTAGNLFVDTFTCS